MSIWKEAEKNIVIHQKGMNVIESCIDRHALRIPEKKAFVFENDLGERISYSYKELEEETSRFANLITNFGVKKKSRVFMFLPKIPEMYIAILGTIKAGSIAAPLFEAFQSEGAMLRLERGEANVLVTNKELLSRIPSDVKQKIPSLKQIIVVDSLEYRREIERQSVKFKTVMMGKGNTALMIFTSSTAGTPVAGVEISHYGIVQQDATARLVLRLKAEDNYWCTAHPGWVTGSVYGILAPLSVGCTVYILEGHFDSNKWIRFMKRNYISVIYTAPTALRMLQPDLRKEDVAGIRNICSVGEALPEAVFDYYLKNLGMEINNTYWQTETGAMVIANYGEMERKPGSLGKPIPGITAKIEGEMIVLKKGWPAMMTGIYKHNKMYKDYFSGDWFKTNDRARIDSEGYVFFEGRKDEIIKTSGERVSPLEIENVLLQHKAVREVAVIGIPDSMKGEVIKAFVVLNSGFRESDELKEELKMFVKQGYAGHAYPKEIEFLDSLPKNNAGKIVRMELREREIRKKK